MSSADPNAASPRGAPQHGGAPSRHDPALLEAILEKALAGPETDLDAQTLQALRGVAQQHSGHPLTLDPTTIDLVDAVLRLHVRQPAADRRSMAATLAQSLWDNPNARMRLERLWNLLGQNSP